MSSEPISLMGMQLLASTGPVVFVSLIVVILRLYTKFCVLKNSGLEELFITLAWILAATFWGMVVYLVLYHGMGTTLFALPPSQFSAITGFLQIFFGCIFIYNFSLSAAKLSIIIQYLQIFPTGKTRYASWVALILVCINVIWTFFINLFYCIPVEKFWDPTLPGTCLPRKAALFSYAGANIATSCFIILIPLPSIWSLKLAWRTKTALVLVFAFGIVDVVFGSARINALNHLATTIDITYWSARVAIWSSLETTLAIICASAPVLRPLIARWVPEFLSTVSNKSGRRTSGQSSVRGSKILKKSWIPGIHQSGISDHDIEMQPEVGDRDGNARGELELTVDRRDFTTHAVKKETFQTWLHEGSEQGLDSSSLSQSCGSRPTTQHEHQHQHSVLEFPLPPIRINTGLNMNDRNDDWMHERIDEKSK